MNAISTDTLREKFLQFFESKRHARIPSAPLVPENDPSVLFTTAGMHPLVPYLKGQPHPAGKRLTNAQKCLRTTDIEAVGDATHATVFEMLGNWSLGDYFKADAIAYSWEFLTSEQWLSIDPSYVAVSVFAGDADAPRDEESASMWQRLGVPESRIAYLGKEDNWWPAYAPPVGGATAGKPAGNVPAGPQGPDTEMFYWCANTPPPDHFDPTDKNWVEIWNDVFIQYDRGADGELRELSQQNVDTGMGLERTVMILNELSSIYEIDTFAPLLTWLDAQIRQPDERWRRILADHLKAITFVLGDDVLVQPSNTERGYVARRLIRRAVVAARTLRIEGITAAMTRGLQVIVEQYSNVYPSLLSRADEAERLLREELHKFEMALDRGLNELAKNQTGSFTGYQVFGVSSTYAVPIELAEEFIVGRGDSFSPNYAQELAEARTQHQEKSRTAAAGKFKGGLADHSVRSVQYHTATHLLNQALRDVLGDHVLQKGSNITPERLRFDFSHGEKLTAQQRAQVEAIVNEKIQADLPVERQEMTVAEARAAGALGLFAEKYGERVSVYSIGDYSREICGGPHVRRTGELGYLRITKEESLGKGIRRLKAEFSPAGQA
ncbi:MAG TPA: alanine--tRNA ligase [Candidatus Andersenbacteria bacterium]|nr:alanine--tRNA ligase [Candidatus Andersenbacteria bacterium]